MADAPIEPIAIAMTVNRTEVSVEVAPSESLSYTLRVRLGLTGTKLSCDVQACGACTVLVDGLPRSSCTYLTYEARDREVLSIEGLAVDGALDPVQEAFVAESAFQCGFCTPGMILTAHAYLAREGEMGSDSSLDDEELIEHMSGNLCRCTGYLPIVAAMLRARKANSVRAAAGPAAISGRQG